MTHMGRLDEVLTDNNFGWNNEQKIFFDGINVLAFILTIVNPKLIWR